MLDENIPLKTAEFLKQTGYTVLTLYELGKLGLSDLEIADLAIKHKAIIVTLDLDFGQIYYFLKRKKVGIIVLRLKQAIPEKINLLLEKFLKEIKLKGKIKKSLIIVEEDKVRTLF